MKKIVLLLHISDATQAADNCNAKACTSVPDMCHMLSIHMGNEDMEAIWKCVDNKVECAGCLSVPDADVVIAQC